MYHDFPSNFFLSHIPGKFRRGTRPCFTKFPVMKKIRDKRGGGYHDFPSKRFCLRVPKNFVGEPFCAVFQTISGIEKTHGEEGGEPRFLVEYFLSHSAEKFFNGTSLCFTELPFSKNVKEKRGCDSSLSVENFIVSRGRKSSLGNPSVMCFRKIPVAKKLEEKWGASRGSVEKILSHSAEYFPRRPLIFSLISGIEQCQG